MNARSFQTMVPMRDGTRLNTFGFLPDDGGPRWPVILHRTPYGIAAADAPHKFDHTRAWLPNLAEPMRGSILRGWKAIVEHGYVAVYQDCRGRHGSEGEDRVYADDANDGYDTLAWIASQSWTNGRVGMSGSSAGATTTFAAAATRHPSMRAFFAQAGASSIYDDVIYEGQGIEMERLWLWVARNIPGLSASHREAVMARFGVGAVELDRAAASAAERYNRLDVARQHDAPFINSPDWLRLPLTGYPDFSLWQPFLDEIITHPTPDSFRARHNFRRTIDIPGFHVTSWFDIFQTSIIAAFQEIQARTGTQKLWVGPNEHYFVYASNFWPRDPYFEWFGYWLKDEPSTLISEPPVYYSPRGWVDERATYVPNDWVRAERWPPPGVSPRRLYLCGDGSLAEMPAGEHAGDGDAGRGHPPAGDRQAKRKSAEAADRPIALPGRIHALGRQGADQPLRLVFCGRRAPEIVPDRGDRLPDLLHRGAGSNFNAHGVLGLYAVIRTATHPTAPLGYGQLPICAPAYPGPRRADARLPADSAWAASAGLATSGCGSCWCWRQPPSSNTPSRVGQPPRRGCSTC